MKIGRHSIEISNPDKVLFPDVGLTKRDLIEYYERIGEVMVPHMREPRKRLDVLLRDAPAA